MSVKELPTIKISNHIYTIDFKLKEIRCNERLSLHKYGINFIPFNSNTGQYILNKYDKQIQGNDLSEY